MRNGPKRESMGLVSLGTLAFLAGGHRKRRYWLHCQPRSNIGCGHRGPEGRRTMRGFCPVALAASLVSREESLPGSCQPRRPQCLEEGDELVALDGAGSLEALG